MNLSYKTVLVSYLIYYSCLLSKLAIIKYTLKFIQKCNIRSWWRVITFLHHEWSEYCELEFIFSASLDPTSYDVISVHTCIFNFLSCIWLTDHKIILGLYITEFPLICLIFFMINYGISVYKGKIRSSTSCSW